MEKKDLRIVYMGTPDFAVESLKRLVEGGYNVVGVITMPDKPMGRHGSVLQPSPVKEYAVSQGLRVLQPEKLKDEAFVEELRSLQADLQIVVAFRMLPEIVWNMPRLGTFNLHASLLPQYRGAAPINWAVINGDTETGITTFFLKHEIDTGEIIQQVRVPIADTDNVEIVAEAQLALCLYAPPAGKLCPPGGPHRVVHRHVSGPAQPALGHPRPCGPAAQSLSDDAGLPHRHRLLPRFRHRGSAAGLVQRRSPHQPHPAHPAG